MVVFNDFEIDKLIEEDVPYFDLTTHILGIDSKPGKIYYTARHEAVVCGTEECLRIMDKFNVSVEHYVPSGKRVSSGELIIRASADAGALHRVWKVVQNILEYASGIATLTNTLVRRAKAVNPDVEIVTTRKAFPLSKKLCVKAVLSGGALPHRLGLSETVLVFGNHLRFVGGLEAFLHKLHHIKGKIPEKKVVVEVKTVNDAVSALRAGVDVLQLDKFDVDDVRKVVEARDTFSAFTRIAVAGGINEHNVQDYASLGVDVIVLSSAYWAKPADIGVRIEPC